MQLSSQKYTKATHSGHTYMCLSIIYRDILLISCKQHRLSLSLSLNNAQQKSYTHSQSNQKSPYRSHIYYIILMFISLHTAGLLPIICMCASTHVLNHDEPHTHILYIFPSRAVDICFCLCVSVCVCILQFTTHTHTAHPQLVD